MLKGRKFAFHVGRGLAIGTIGALALATAALGANGTLGGASAAVDQSSGSASGVASVTLPAAASDMASKVLAAITAGTNPSTAVAEQSEHATSQTSDEHATTATTTAKNDEETASSSNETEDNDISEASEVHRASTTGTMPGWGCGDTNHKHNGPPGNPTATSPCNKH